MDRLRKQLTRALDDHLAGEPLRLPEGAAVLWNAFTALSHARTLGPVGPNPIQHSEIEAWARLMRMPLESRHVAILAEMDRIWMRDAYSKKPAPEGVKTLPARSTQAITPGLFDLVVG
ncbi:MAG: hypothetical protein RIA08_10855 [Roseovarius sp.]|uniref:phage tail assembly chaperone n=1 Tax=Roseovarius sp. TaxID=1486281 RepID=UPI0032EEE64C